MSLTAGIVGLPNVGKSTLFNAITKSNVLAANYPFATIEPNVGIVNVKDERLDYLASLYNPKKTTYATCEFTDIAGLVEGASKGEGLGNQFLANIRNCDAILHVVRCFENKNITHVSNKIDPVSDAEIINLELALADLDVVEKRIPKIEKKAQTKVDDSAIVEYELMLKIKDALLNNSSIRSLNLSSQEEAIIKPFGFLTNKKVLYVANLDDSQILDYESDSNFIALKEYATKNNASIIPISAQIEAELATLDYEEKMMYVEELGLPLDGLDNLIKATYQILGLKTFLTCGPDECRAWTFKDGMKAPECAGIIHSDFERGFIRAETVSFNDLKECGNMTKVKELGKYRSEGKDYVTQDGDIMLFRFNV